MSKRAPLVFLMALCAGVLALVSLAELPASLLLLVPAALFGFGAYLAYAQLPSPRPWLLLAVLALLASFAPWGAFFDRRFVILNALLVVLSGGSLYANVRGEQRRLRQ